MNDSTSYLLLAGLLLPFGGAALYHRGPRSRVWSLRRHPLRADSLPRRGGVRAYPKAPLKGELAAAIAKRHPKAPLKGELAAAIAAD